MALNITRDKGEVHSKGGGTIKVQEVLETGADLTPRAVVVDLGYLQDSEFEDGTPSEDVKDETGNVVTQELGDRSVFVKGTLMQSGAGVLGIAKEVRGKFYRLYKYNGAPDGTNQEMFFAVGKITPSVNIKFAGGRVPFEYKASENASAVTIDSTGLSLIGAYTSSPVTISAKGYYEIASTVQS